MIEGLSHITLIVRDSDRMERILTTVFDATKVYESGARTYSLSPERFYLIGGTWLAVMEGEPPAQPSYNHVAFKISDGDHDLRLERIRSLGLTILGGRPRVEGEGRSIYFRTEDNHLFELHSGTLEERLRRYAQPPSDAD